MKSKTHEVKRASTLLEPTEKGFIQVKDIPKYPIYQYLIAKGGEFTYEIDPESPVTKRGFDWKGWKYHVPIVKRKAIIGERLRDPSLKFRMDWSQNLIFRMTIKKIAEGNPGYQQFQMGLCRSSVLYFINVFCDTYDPRLPKHKKVPFVTFPFQDEVVEWMVWLVANSQTGVIEKSRDMGLSWLMVVTGAWFALFYPHFTEYWMSMTEAEVDNRGPDSLMGKLRMVLDGLPPWMRKGWQEGKISCDKSMWIKIPDTSSFIEGRLTQGTGSRGGRASWAINDETAFVENMGTVAAAQSAVTDCWIYNSTPNGPGNFFAQIAKNPNYNKKTCHWKKHPLKDVSWAKYARAQPMYAGGDALWAQEQECNYEVSAQGRVFPGFTSSSVNEEQWVHVQSGPLFEYDIRYPTLVGMDLGVSDPTSVVFAQLKPVPDEFLDRGAKEMLVFFDEEEAANLLAKDWAKILKEKGYRYGEIIGDAWLGPQRDSGGATWFKNLQAEGIPIKGKRSPEINTIMKMHQKLAQPAAIAINSYRCPFLVEAFQGWAYPVNNETGRPLPGSKPVHDSYSHVMKATLYLVDYIFGDEEFQGISNKKQIKGYRPLRNVRGV